MKSYPVEFSGSRCFFAWRGRWLVVLYRCGLAKSAALPNRAGRLGE